MVNKTFQGIINDEDELENSASDVLSDEETDQDTEPPDSDDDIDIEDAIHSAIKCLKDSFEGELTERNIEIGVIKSAD